jgi:hypothetical protein
MRKYLKMGSLIEGKGRIERSRGEREKGPQRVAVQHARRNYIPKRNYTQVHKFSGSSYIREGRRIGEFKQLWAESLGGLVSAVCLTQKPGKRWVDQHAARYYRG